jgi:hypothetical protein
MEAAMEEVGVEVALHPARAYSIKESYDSEGWPSRLFLRT